MKEKFGVNDNALTKLSSKYSVIGELETLQANISILLTFMDSFIQQKIECSEILKDLITIRNDIINDQDTFDFRRVKLLESWILKNKYYDNKREFFPIGNKASSHAFFVYTQARKAERVYLSINQNDASIYLNRLSDYFYSLTRYINQEVGIEDYL